MGCYFRIMLALYKEERCANKVKCKQLFQKISSETTGYEYHDYTNKYLILWADYCVMPLEVG